jgi:hypothetical protein
VIACTSTPLLRDGHRTCAARLQPDGSCRRRCHRPTRGCLAGEPIPPTVVGAGVKAVPTARSHVNCTQRSGAARHGRSAGPDRAHRRYPRSCRACRSSNWHNKRPRPLLLGLSSRQELRGAGFRRRAPLQDSSFRVVRSARPGSGIRARQGDMGRPAWDHHGSQHGLLTVRARGTRREPEHQPHPACSENFETSHFTAAPWPLLPTAPKRRT